MAIKFTVFLFSLQLMFYYTCFCQDSVTTYKSNHFLTLQSGYSKHIVKDDIVSPLVYSGWQIPIFVNYQGFTKKSVQSISLYFDYLKLTSPITMKTPTQAFYSKNYNAFMEYTYSAKVYSHNRWKMNAFVGGQLKGLLNLRDHYYSNYTHYSSGELLGSLGLSMCIVKRFSRSQNDFISFRYNMSMVAYDMMNYLYNVNVAKEFNTDADQNTTRNLRSLNKVVSFNQYTEFQTELVYARFVNKHWGVSLRHYFQYYKEEKFKDLFYARYVNNQFLAGVLYKL